MSKASNSLNWFEIAVTDLDKASAFYAAVLGHPLKHENFGGIPHAVFPAEGEAAVTGALIQDPQRKPAGTGTVIYLDISDLDQAVARATKAGGKVVQPVTDIGPFGTCALIQDRDGNVVGLHTPKA